ncbi:MAG: MBL fold metallo-hydrolase [Acidimicrobiales bacterium]
MPYRQLHIRSGSVRADDAGKPVVICEGVTRVLAPNQGFMTGPGTNTYLVGSEELAVIDPGPADDAHINAVLSAVGSLSGALRWVLVTHTHPDHAPAAAALASRTGAKILGFGARDGFVPNQAIGDGFVLQISGANLRALHTPGHCSDHLCYLHEGLGMLFSGDHVVDGSTVVIAPPDGDMARYLASLERLRVLEPPIAVIAPGHGGIIRDPLERIEWYIAHRNEREHAIIDAMADLAPARVRDIVKLVYADEPEAVHSLAAYSVWAHLLKLAGDGVARSRGSVNATSVDAEDSCGIDDLWELL